MSDVGGAVAAAEVLAGDPGRGGDPEAEGRCANCEAALTGPYCAECGQRAHLHHRIRDLVHEALESIAHFDGRLWRTLPLLARDPGRLSREWRAGRRARYVQPLHLFLFATFLLFVIPNFTGRHLIELPDVRTAEQGVIANLRADSTEEQRLVAQAVAGAAATDPAELSGAERWGVEMGRKFRHVAENNQYYGYRIEGLAYKLSFLIVPLSMLILALLLAFKRGFSFYDHGVVALYGVGFLTLMLAVASVFPPPVGRWLGATALVLAPLHAIVHLKGAYGLSWLGAILRGVLLSLFSAIGFILFIAGVFLLGVFG